MGSIVAVELVLSEGCHHENTGRGEPTVNRSFQNVKYIDATGYFILAKVSYAFDFEYHLFDLYYLFIKFNKYIGIDNKS